MGYPLDISDFDAAFRALDAAYRPPLKWQTRLYQRFVRGDVPGVCRLPTGLGKTSVIPIWLIALASGTPLPRRLVYIVNRRTVVDQATDDGNRILQRIEHPAEAGEYDGTARRLRESLTHLASDTSATPLAISTLRGELADNGEWKKNPARPAIIIGTIDMIGSKLLFSGYGDGRYGRSHHAGLIGQDALVVHDEAHLAPAFDELIGAVEQEQVRTKEARPIRVIRLSATTRNVGDHAVASNAIFGIEDEDHADGIVSRRLNAVKTLRLCETEKDKLVHRVVEEASRLGEKPHRILIYVRSPDTAARVVDEIKKRLGKGAEDRVGLLTGTIRGFERDQLAKGTLISTFQSRSERSALDKALFLVSTSAGEVGADLDADHLVCDLSTLDSMTQRFGRVNRLGGAQRLADVIVIAEKLDEKKGSPLSEAIAKTGEILKTISAKGGDVSPAALEKVLGSLSSDDLRAAFSPQPKILHATDIHFDHWSLTSIAGEMPGRPEVGPYLHGKPEDWEPPETCLAWRADIGELAKAGGKDDDGNDRPCSPGDLERVFDVFPLRSIEQLRERSDRVLEELQGLAERHSGQQVVVMKGGEIRWALLADLAPRDKNQKRAFARLAYATIVLPTEIGGLSENGTLDGGQEPPGDPVNPQAHRLLDVAENPATGKADRQRVRVSGSGDPDDGMPLVGGETIDAIPRHSVTLAGGDDGDDAPRAIEYRVIRGVEREPGVRVGLDAHNAAVGAAAAWMAKTLGLPDEITTAVALAGRHHDTGKGTGREIWQRYAFNLPHRDRPGGEIAKSDKYGHWKDLGGYRHEFGSLLDVAIGPVGGEAPSEVANHPERELILHLIAAHHGWARPHFEPRHFDPGGRAHPRDTATNERAATEVMRRFARLQRRFGRWGLAWLESLLRCADAEASDAAAPEGSAP